jgi:hypothetical protein
MGLLKESIKPSYQRKDGRFKKEIDERILKVLIKTFQGEQVEIKEYLVLPFTLSLGRSNVGPVDMFHLDTDAEEGEIQLNFWIARKKVMGRPLSFVKSGSTTQTTSIFQTTSSPSFQRWRRDRSLPFEVIKFGMDLR